MTEQHGIIWLSLERWRTEQPCVHGAGRKIWFVQVTATWCNYWTELSVLVAGGYDICIIGILLFHPIFNQQLFTDGGGGDMDCRPACLACWFLCHNIIFRVMQWIMSQQWNEMITEPASAMLDCPDFAPDTYYTYRELSPPSFVPSLFHSFNWKGSVCIVGTASK